MISRPDWCNIEVGNVILSAMRLICPKEADNVIFRVSPSLKGDIADLMTNAAGNLFSILKKQMYMDVSSIKCRNDQVIVISPMDRVDLFTLYELANAIVSVAVVGKDTQIHSISVLRPGVIYILSEQAMAQRQLNGKAPCPRCGKFIKVKSSGLELHLKMVHSVQTFAEANTVANVATSQAIIRDNNKNNYLPIGDFVTLSSHDLNEAMKDPAILKQKLQEGKVRPLCPLLESCRFGDLYTLKKYVEHDNIRPETIVDKHGSGPLSWAAGGGHLEVLKYLVHVCGMDPLIDGIGPAARRGYRGRTALHWAARNGHIHVLRWLIFEHGASVDYPTYDGTSAFCWAAWKGHLDTLRFLYEETRCNPHALNAFGCNAAMWAAQGADISVCKYLHSIGIDFFRINNSGQGCLHKAAQRGHFDICVWLLQTVGLASDPAHFCANHFEGLKPWELAIISGNEHLSIWLREQESRP